MKTLLFNPFEKYSEKTLLLFGILFSLIGGFLGFTFNARFDGVIDLHFIEKVIIYQPILDIVIAVLCTTLLLFAVGKFINRKTRIIDILSANMIARIPFYLLTFFNINNFMYNITLKMMTMIQPEKVDNISTSDLFIIAVFGIITILFFVWFVVLIFNGFKVATNAKGVKQTVFFILAIILSEILSKTIISFIN